MSKEQLVLARSLSRVVSDIEAEPSGIRLERRELDFQALYHEHFAMVWRVLRGLGISQASLDDAVQDVFIVVHRRLADFEGRSSLRTWLYSVAYRVGSNYKRQARRRPAMDELPPTLASHAPSPFAQLETREAWRALELYLDSLSHEMRSVFVLSLLEEATAPEVSEALSIPINTVYTRLHSMRQTLRLTLKIQPGEVP